MSSPFPTIGTIADIPAHGGWSAAFAVSNGQPFVITAPDAESLRSACDALGLKLDKPHEMHGVMILDRRTVMERKLLIPAVIEAVPLAVDPDPMPHGHQDISDNTPGPAPAVRNEIEDY